MPSGRRSGAVVRDERPRGTVLRLRYQDASGRRVCETLGLETEGWTTRRAEEALRERLVDVKRDRLTKARPLRFEEFATEALEGYLDAKGRRKSTRAGYLAVAEQHLVPYFGRMQLDSIEPHDVDAYVAKKRRGGLSAASVNRHLNVLRRVCRLAVRAGKMRTNEPCPERRRARGARQKAPVASSATGGGGRGREGIHELIAAETAKDERAWIEQARVVFLVIYGLGLRRGEVLGLRWRSIQLADPEHKPTLSVEQATVRGHDGPPKSATSRRTLVLDEFLAGELFDHLGRSRYQGDGERVFCHPLKGSALDHKRYADTFRAALKKAGIEDYVRPFHDGRHSAITNDAAAGNGGMAVMKRAGHSDFRTTQLYLDLAGVEFAEEAERAAARAFAHVPRAKVRATGEAE